MKELTGQQRISPPLSFARQARRCPRVNSWLLSGASFAILAPISFIPPAYAADINVSNSTEFVQALTDASTDAEPTTIRLQGDVSVTAPTVLPSAVAPESVTIDTTGGHTLTLDGTGTIWDAGRYTTMVVEGSLDGGLTLSGGANVTIHDNPGNSQPYGQLLQNSGGQSAGGESPLLVRRRCRHAVPHPRHLGTVDDRHGGIFRLHPDDQ
ncbi:hypothetical protein ABIE08_002345 [Kaistia defluvii]|uniref:Autotransporter outer membrane beta-barrel domain-containing protein n=1 Tax=Kaistia defluvii TaxID=410841 RepID=A0ABV2QZI8_9HYPH